MKATKFLLTSVLALTASSALAQPILTGKEMLAHCTNNASNSSLCFGYAIGVMDGLMNADILANTPNANVCPRADVSYYQTIRVGIKYLRDHPADLQSPASALLVEAYRNAYPCKR